MFTGIVTAIGTVIKREERGDIRLRIASPWDPGSIAVGASIACSGCCLTVVGKGGDRAGGRGGDADAAWFDVDLSAETVTHTNAARWAEGARLNLEPALKLGDELGGHIVTGHVDAVGRVSKAENEGDSIRLTILAPKTLAPFIAAKGSITVDGVSLTVNAVEDTDEGCEFGLNIIPHTGEVTTLGKLTAGDEVNLEIDTLARYLHRMQALRG